MELAGLQKAQDKQIKSTSGVDSRISVLTKNLNRNPGLMRRDNPLSQSQNHKIDQLKKEEKKSIGSGTSRLTEPQKGISRYGNTASQSSFVSNNSVRKSTLVQVPQKHLVSSKPQKVSNATNSRN